MKLFIKSSLCFCCIIIALHIIISYIVDLNGWSDWAYKRLRSSGEKSIIIGTSRAAQGIHPDVINRELKTSDYFLPIYNFSFTIGTSPYGKIYYNAIKKKLSKEKYNNGLFILSVDPWALSIEKNKLDKERLREKNNCLAGVYEYMHPNFFYLWRYAELPFKKDPRVQLNDNGWLEVNISMDSASLKKRFMNKKEEYSKYSIIKSEYRLEWLSKTIQYLKRKGSVFLVRIPASTFFLELENKNWPNFDNDIEKIASEEHVEYISFGNQFGKYHTTDGQHLYKEDGSMFTKDLCDSIKKRINK